MTVYDWSFASVTPAQLEAAGAQGWLRYVASDHRKTITAGELAALHAAGLPGALVHEEGASWRTWNSSTANRIADGLRWPEERPIYYAADNDLDPSEYPAVADTLASMIGRPRGIYGESGLVQHCLDAGAALFGWITNAAGWSHAGAPGAHLHQLLGSPIPGTDSNTVLAPDWGQHPLSLTLPEQETDDMPKPALQVRTTDDGGTIVVIPYDGAQPWIADNPVGLQVLIDAGAVGPAVLEEHDPVRAKQIRQLAAR